MTPRDALADGLRRFDPESGDGTLPMFDYWADGLLSALAAEGWVLTLAAPDPAPHSHGGLIVTHNGVPDPAPLDGICPVCERPITSKHHLTYQPCPEDDDEGPGWKTMPAPDPAPLDADAAWEAFGDEGWVGFERAKALHRPVIEAAILRAAK